MPLYLEDFAVGQKFVTGSVRVDPDAVTAFARQFDPQPFHLHEEGGRGTTLNQRGEPVQVLLINLLVRAREA